MAKEAKSSLVYSVFQNISEGYDRKNDLISLGMQRGWKKMLTGSLIEWLPGKGKMLDVCCGTGDIGIAVADSRPDVQVTSADFSPAMLEVARRKAGTLRNISFYEADAMELPWEDGAFNASAVSFGLRNTADYLKVLQEMARVTAPGGRVMCLDSFVPKAPLVLPFYRLYFMHLMPALAGGWKHRKEYRWLSESTDRFISPDELAGLFAQAGLVNVKRKSRLFGACVLLCGKKPRERQSE